MKLALSGLSFAQFSPGFFDNILINISWNCLIRFYVRLSLDYLNMWTNIVDASRLFSWYRNIKILHNVLFSLFCILKNKRAGTERAAEGEKIFLYARHRLSSHKVDQHVDMVISLKGLLAKNFIGLKDVLYALYVKNLTTWYKSRKTHFYGLATDHLEVGIWVVWSVCPNTNFKTSNLCQMTKLKIAWFTSHHASWSWSMKHGAWLMHHASYAMVMTYDIMMYDVMTYEGMTYDILTYDVMTNDIMTKCKNAWHHDKMQKMWKSLKNICPKVKQILPAAKRNHQGKMVSSKNYIKKLLAQEFNNRLRPRPYRNDFIATKVRRKNFLTWNWK